MGITITKPQEQMILSGLLHTGKIIRNGRNYYYRETFPERRYDFCQFKCEVLGDLISKSGIHPIKNQQGRIGFCTVNDPVFIAYRACTNMDLIRRMDDLGLVTFLLTQGRVVGARMTISGSHLSEDEYLVIAERMKALFDIDARIYQKGIILTATDFMKLFPIVYQVTREYGLNFMDQIYPSNVTITPIG